MCIHKHEGKPSFHRQPAKACRRSAEEGQREVSVRLAELGADLNKTDRISGTCCNCISVCCCIIVMLTFFFGQIWKDGSTPFSLDKYGKTALMLAA